jgi:acyl carrier protein
LPKSDVAVTFTVSGEACRATLEYDRSLLSAREAGALLDQLELALDAASTDLDAAVTRPLDPAPGSSVAPVPPAPTVRARFEALCRRTGDRVAVVDAEGRRWTRARLAEVLEERRLGGEAPEAAAGVADVVAVLGAACEDTALLGMPPSDAGSLVTRVDWLTAALGQQMAGDDWVLASDGSPGVLEVLWPLLSERGCLDLSASPSRAATTVRLVAAHELAGPPRPDAAPTLLMVLGEATAAWCAEASSTHGSRVLRLWAPDGVPVARWADRPRRVLLPAPDVELEVRGALGPAAEFGVGELVVRQGSARYSPRATGVPARRTPEGVELRGRGHDLEDAIVRAGVAPLAVQLFDDDSGIRFAFVVPAGDTPDGDALLQRVVALLPPDEAPDRLALVPAIPADARQAARQLLESEPAHAALADVLRAWAEVLGAPPASPDQSFFDAGGTSVRALALQAALERTVGCEIPLNAVFEFATARQLATFLARSREPAPATPPPVDRSPLVRLRARRGGLRDTPGSSH